jgi:hypothetical protein
MLRGAAAFLNLAIGVASFVDLQGIAGHSLVADVSDGTRATDGNAAVNAGIVFCAG